MTASRFWPSVGCMLVTVLQNAASHPRPILCGDLADAAAVRSSFKNSLGQAEWHNLTLALPSGQGYLLDLLRQRGSIEHIVLALPAISCARDETYDDASRPMDHCRRGLGMRLIAVLRDAETTLDASIGAGLTLLRVDAAEASSPIELAVGAFAGEWIASEVARWATLGLSLSQPIRGRIIPMKMSAQGPSAATM